MLEFFTSVNTWVTNHQVLVVTLGVPLLTLAVTTVVGFVTVKMSLASQAAANRLQERLKLLELRQERVLELRRLCSRFMFLTMHAQIELRQENSKLAPSKPIDDQYLAEILKTMCEISVYVPRNDPDRQALEQAMEIQLKSVTDVEMVEKAAAEKKFALVSDRIIARLDSIENVIADK